MFHTMVLTTREIQYIRVALCLHRKSDYYPKNDIHFNVINKEIIRKFETELRPLMKVK